MAQGDHVLLTPARSAHDRRRRGFTLVEVIVTATLIAVLAAVLIPVVLGRIDQGRSAALGQTLDALGDAIQSYRADVRRYPTQLRNLVTPPDAGLQDLCGQTVPAQFRSEWRGPYIRRSVEASGIAVGDAVVLDTLELDPAGPYTVATNGHIVIVAEDVDSRVAAQVESAFDRGDDFTAGTVRFSPTSSGQGTLRYRMPVRGC